MTADADWIDNLARLAEAATPGPWEARRDDLNDEVTVVHDQERVFYVAGVGVYGMPRVMADAEFIAAANPAAILRLIEENRNLRTTVDADLEYQRRLEARLAAVIRAAGKATGDPESDLRATRVCYTDECGEPCRSHVASLWAERDAARKAAGVAGERLGKERAKVAAVQAQRDRWKAAWEMALPLLTERDALAAKVAAVEALADEWERRAQLAESTADTLAEFAGRVSLRQHAVAMSNRAEDLRAALSAAPTDTTKET